MLTTRYHIGSLIAVFLALGIGLVVGGTLGRGWVNEAEERVVGMLSSRYEEQQAENLELRRRLESLRLIGKQVSPLQGRDIVWINQTGESNDLLAYAVESLGANWQEVLVPETERPETWLEKSGIAGDLVLYSGNAAPVPDDQAVRTYAEQRAEWLALGQIQNSPQSVAAVVARMSDAMKEDGDEATANVR